MQKLRFLSRGGLLVALFLFLALNLVASPLLRSARLDLTEQNLNTLSEGTRNILTGIERPITLKLFLSQKALKMIPGLDSYAERVTSLLDEYVQVAGASLKIEQIDPEPFSAAEDEAVQFGLQGVQLSAGSDSLYFGLVGELDEHRKVIPFFQPERERFLEYDLSQMIYQLSHPQRLIVGLLSGAPVEGGFSSSNNPRMERPWVILEQLRQQFELRTIPKTGAPVADDVDVLLLIHPAGLDARSLYAADQFLLRGGRALIFADPLSEASVQAGFEKALSPNPDFDRMLAGWGVQLEAGKVVGDLTQSHKVNYQGRRGTMQINYLPWLNVDREALSASDVVTSELGNLNLATVGSLTPTQTAQTEFIPLIHSSSEAMLIDSDSIAFAPNPARLLADFKPSGQPFILAGRVNGNIQSGFPAGRPEDLEQSAPGAEKTPQQQPGTEHLQQSSSPANLIIVADSDLLQDRFWVQITNVLGRQMVMPTAANADLVSNAIESLGGSSDLIAVRSRGSYQRPFTLVAELQQKAEISYRAKEQELTAKLRDTETKLNELQRQREDSGATTLSAEQEAEVDRFLAEKLRTRKQLRDVQYQLRAEIEDLEGILKAFNIVFVPGLIALIAFVAWTIRRARGRNF